ncbi:hypothetical protein JDS73_31925, partial [Bacillus cereus]|nr:hypothetical protein [Bacillus cereus]
ALARSRAPVAVTQRAVHGSRATVCNPAPPVQGSAPTVSQTAPSVQGSAPTVSQQKVHQQDKNLSQNTEHQPGRVEKQTKHQ